MGPMPCTASRSGRQVLTRRRISRSCSAASAVRSWMRRAQVRRQVTTVTVSMSVVAQGAVGRSAAAVATSCVGVESAQTCADRLGCGQDRGEQLTASVPAPWTAERRMASRFASACRVPAWSGSGPAPRGVPTRSRESASRAARTASSGSDFSPPRRAGRSGRSSSRTSSSTVLEMDREPPAVASGALDRPGPQRGVGGADLVGELHQLGVALGGGLDADLRQDSTGAGVDRGRGVGVRRGCRRRSRHRQPPTT